MELGPRPGAQLSSTATRGENSLVPIQSGRASLAATPMSDPFAFTVDAPSPDQADRAPPKDPEPPTTVELCHKDGKPLAYKRFLVLMDDGSEVSGMTDGDGKAELDLKAGGTVTFPDLSEAEAE